MNRLSLYALSALALLFSACGDDYRVDDSNPKLSQYVFGISDGASGNIVNFYTPLGDLYIEQGQTVKFYAGYSYDDAIVIDESLQEYFSGLSWDIGGDYFNLSSFRYTFHTPGMVEASLETTDLYGDTLHNDFRIFVNTPNSIALEFPYDGYNQAEPTGNQQLPLRWTVQGIDPWETTSCHIFIASSPDSVWDNHIGTTECDAEVYLGGSLVDDIDTALTRDSSFALYWGVKLVSRNESGREYRDSSSIFKFSTKIQNDSSTVKIPIAFDGFKSNVPLMSQVFFISASGDTLQKFTVLNKVNFLTAKVKPQSRLKIVVKETLRTEYASESLSVDIPPHTVVELDTLLLTDKVAPQITPFKTTVARNDSIQFLVYDDGSGINPAKLTVVMDGDTLKTAYRAPTLLFKAKCQEHCLFNINGEDYAHNILPRVVWRLDNQTDTYSITGPFSSDGY